jgi:hypothetical protein
MRAVRISLIIVLVLGLWITIRSSNDLRVESFTRPADMQATTMREQGSVPGWAHAMAIGASFVIVLAWLRKS